jgi:hypothetical protein
VNGREAAQGPQWGFFAIGEAGDARKDLPLVDWTRRTGLTWPKLELRPATGRYDWNHLDGLVKKAQESDLNLVFVLKTGNHPEVSEAACQREARTKREKDLASCPIREGYLPAWKQLVGAIIERYDGDGKSDMPGLAPRFTLDIQVENEAGYRIYWQPDEPDGTRAAKAFLPLLRLAYEAKEAANPATRIITPGITQPHTLARCARNPSGPPGARDDVDGPRPGVARRGPRPRRGPREPTDDDGEGSGGCSSSLYVRNRDFNEELLKHPQYFDAVDVHFFNYFRFDPTFIPDGIGWVRERMRRAGYEKPIYSLEWTGAMMMNVKRDGHLGAFLSFFPFKEAGNAAALQQIYRNLSDPRNEKYRRWFELEQAREFPKLFTTLLAQGVQRLIHVQYHDYLGQGWNSAWWNWQGIVRYEGTRRSPVVIRKPAFYTYQTLAPKLAGLQSVEVLAFGDTVAYKFLFPDRKAVVVAWSNRGEQTMDLSSHVKANLLRVTPLLTEPGDQDRPIRPRTEAVQASAVRLSDTPVLLEVAEGSN